MTRRLIAILGFPLVLAALGMGVLGFSIAIRDPELRARNAELAADLANLKANNVRLEREVKSMTAEVARLREGTRESLFQARTRLGMVRGGEILYQFVTEPAAPKEAK